MVKRKGRSKELDLYGFIKEVKRKDGRNEMNDLKPKEGSNKRNSRVAMKQACKRMDCVGVDTNGRT